MKVSSVTEHLKNENFKRNDFIRLSNMFMSNPENTNTTEKIHAVNKKSGKLGIENLQEFTIFPREVIDGRTVITA